MPFFPRRVAGSSGLLRVFGFFLLLGCSGFFLVADPPARCPSLGASESWKRDERSGRFHAFASIGSIGALGALGDWHPPPRFAQDP